MKSGLVTNLVNKAETATAALLPHTCAPLQLVNPAADPVLERESWHRDNKKWNRPTMKWITELETPGLNFSCNKSTSFHRPLSLSS